MEAILASTSDHLVNSLDFRLKDDSASYVIDRQEANSVFSRMRIVIGGSTAEDLQYFNRLSHTLFQCMPHERQEMLGALGFINDTAPSGGTHGVTPSEIPASGSET